MILTSIYPRNEIKLLSYLSIYLLQDICRRVGWSYARSRAMGVLGGLTVILDPPRRLGQREVQTDGHP